MDIEAIEKIIRNRNDACEILNIVNQWLGDVESENYTLDDEEISVGQWKNLQDSIELYLNERDSK